VKQSLDDIAALAEDLGNTYTTKGRVNLESIAKSKGIRLIQSDYGNHFLGQLVHLSKKFYIILNTDLLSNTESGRVRFTIAHELGHFFIDGHRAKLANGISLSFKGDLNEGDSKKMEIEANHFAAHLLMPKKRFSNMANKLEPGLRGIFLLKTKFDTSIESTVKHYVNLNLSSSIMIKWKADYTLHYAWYTISFSQLTGIKGYAPVKIDTEHLREQVKLIKVNGGDYTESATSISRWISTINPGGPILGLEQTVKLGEFGGITLLTFFQ
jgi:Zn-dependent peptidase ImmA (M78 family)